RHRMSFEWKARQQSLREELIAESCRLATRLASRSGSAGVCHRNAEILVGIHGSVVDADLIVQVRACAATAQTNVTDDFTTMDVLPGADCEGGQVTEASVDSVSVINHDRFSVTAKIICELDHAVRRSKDRLPHRSGDVHAGVEGALSVEWIDALAEGSSDLAFHRPEIRGGICAQPISSCGIARQAKREPRGRRSSQGRILQSVELIQ